MRILCFWPPDIPLPADPIFVFNPKGKLLINSPMFAICIAFQVLNNQYHLHL